MPHRSIESNTAFVVLPLLGAAGFLVGFYPTVGRVGGIGGTILIFILAVTLKVLLGGRIVVSNRLAVRYAIQFLIASLILFAGLAISSLVHLGSTIIDALSIGGQYMAAFFMMFLLFGFLSEREQNVLFWSYLFGGAALCLLGIFVYLFMYEFGRQIGWIWPNGRLEMFSGANALAPQMSFLSLVLIYFGFVKRSWSSLVLLTLAFPFFVILLTGSNTGIIMFATIMFVALFMTLGRQGILIGLFLAVALVLSIQNIDYISEATGSRSVQRFAWLRNADIESAGSFTGRSRAIRVALDYAMDNPVIGVGAGAASKFGLVWQVDHARGQPHNTFVLVWVEGGILALAGLVMWYFVFLRASLRKDVKATAILLLCALAMFMTMSMRAHSYQMWLVFPSMLILSNQFLSRRPSGARDRVQIALVNARTRKETAYQ